MLTLIADLPQGVVGVEAHGKVTAHDYEEVQIPAVEAAKAWLAAGGVAVRARRRGPALHRRSGVGGPPNWVSATNARGSASRSRETMRGSATPSTGSAGRPQDGVRVVGMDEVDSARRG